MLDTDTFCHLEAFHLTSRAAALFGWPPLSVEKGTRTDLGEWTVEKRFQVDFLGSRYRFGVRRETLVKLYGYGDS